jgi:ferric-dicitrate binding protein FerR (iron transport regulator)
MKALDAQFESLVCRHLEGRLSANDESALRVRLHDDAMARARFVELMDLHALLAGDAALAGNVLADADREPAKVVTFPSKYRRVIFGMAAAAAIVLLAATVWMLGRPQVLLLRGVGQEFANASSLPHGELIGQSVDLKQGLLELSFRKADATVVIEAPAKFRIEDAKTLRMESGRVTAHVRDGKQGLRVLTPHTDVLDLGTRFAVDVSDGRRSEPR